jgi:hypothetical protein
MCRLVIGFAVHKTEHTSHPPGVESRMFQSSSLILQGKETVLERGKILLFMRTEHTCTSHLSGVGIRNELLEVYVSI